MTLIDRKTQFGRARGQGSSLKRLKSIAYSTTSSNLRNWCLTRALELEGAINLSRFREHRLSYQPADPSSKTNDAFVESAACSGASKGYESMLSLFLDGEEVAGLNIRNQVAIPMVLGGKIQTEPKLKLEMSKDNWANLISGKVKLSQLIRASAVKCFQIIVLF